MRLRDRPGAQQVTPGFYDLGDGIMHADAVELCEIMGWPPTEENQDRVAEMLRSEAKKRDMPWDEIADIPWSEVES